MSNYLLLELKDGRKFFTKEDNTKNLLEFSKRFEATMQIVNATKPPAVLELNELVKAICAGEELTTPTKYEVVKKIKKRRKKSF